MVVVRIMAKLFAKLMLLLCFWNVAVASSPAFSAAFVEDGIRQSAQSNDPCMKAGDVAADSHAEDCDCDPNNCQNENCKFHQCHFGHCSYLVKEVASDAILSQGITFFSFPNWSIQSVSLSGLTRPPNT
jgi:hypothetical protein